MTNSIAKKIFASAVAVSSAFMGFAPIAAQAVSAGEVYKTTDGTVWFITSDMQRRPFSSGGAFLSYGFLSWAQVQNATAEVNALTAGSIIPPQDGKIFCATATKGSDVNGECALITGGMKAAFTSSAVFSGLGYSFARAQYGDSSFLTKTANLDNAGAAHSAGVLVNIDGTVYLVGSTSLMGIPSVSVFESWGYSFADVVTANSADRSMTKSGIMASRTPGHLSPSTSSSSDEDNNGPLEGGAGAVESYTLASGLSNEEVGEGEEDVQVAGLEIEADDGSDLNITAVKLVFNEGTAASDFEDYASEVSLWMGDNEVARVDGDEFNDDNDWTKTISLEEDAIVRMGETETLYVAVSGNEVIDSGDITDTWTVDFRSVRFVDAQDASTTEDPSTAVTTFSFESFSTAADVELKIDSDDEEINDAHVIDVDDSDDTDDVSLLSFTMEAEGDSDIMIDDLPVTLTSTEAAGGHFDEPGDIVTTLYLYMGDEEIGTESVDGTAAGAADTQVVLFEDLDLTIDAGETEAFTVKAKLVSTGDALDNGDTISADFGETETDLATFDVEDEEGDTVADADITGTADGEAHGLFDAGIMVELVSTDVTKSNGDQAVNSDSGLFEITFDVTAFDGDMYIDASAPLAAGGSGESDLTINGAGTVTATIESPTGATEDAGVSFEVEEGTTERFTITVDIRDGATDMVDGFFDVAIGSIAYVATTSGDADTYYNFNLDDFKTDQVFLDDRE